MRRLLFALRSEISSITGSDPKTIRKYLEKDDFSPEPPVAKERKSIVAPYLDIITGWIEEDQRHWSKQRHTAFQAFLNSEIYVDKTELLSYTNKVLGSMHAFVCNSRPRRFGKSIAANMLAAYYSKCCNSLEMFSGCNNSDSLFHGYKIKQKRSGYDFYDSLSGIIG